MTILNRRRAMGFKSNDYIQDGLMFQLDGINKGGDSSAWTDLKGGAKFAYVSGVTPSDNGVVLASGHGLFVCDRNDIDWDSTTGTVELCLSKIYYSNVIIIWDGRTDARRVKVGYYTGTGSLLAAGNYSSTNSVKNVILNIPTSISIRDDIAYQNGIYLEKVRGSFWGGISNNITIGDRGSANYQSYVGTIYAIRVYNRKLTAEEMIHNQKLDNERFNLGIVFP